MNKNDFIAIIPARYASTRFPGKPLAMLGGMTVIERVYRQVSHVMDTVVATDDERIADTVEAFDGRAVMTSPSHRSGTDRCHEAYVKIASEKKVIVNVQGDEPFVQASQLHALMACFDNESTDIATLVKPFPADGDYEQLENPNTPKVVISPNNEAIYFSRSIVPYLRGIPCRQWPSSMQYYTHIGLYAYRAKVLERITRMQQTPLELAESLEQLRWLENGFTIRVATTQVQTIGIDTPHDLARAEAYLKTMAHE